MDDAAGNVAGNVAGIVGDALDVTREGVAEETLAGAALLRCMTVLAGAEATARAITGEDSVVSEAAPCWARDQTSDSPSPVAFGIARCCSRPINPPVKSGR